MCRSQKALRCLRQKFVQKLRDSICGLLDWLLSWHSFFYAIAGCLHRTPSQTITREHRVSVCGRIIAHLAVLQRFSRTLPLAACQTWLEHQLACILSAIVGHGPIITQRRLHSCLRCYLACSVVAANGTQLPRIQMPKGSRERSTS